MSGMFIDRTPEAAARQLAVVLASATEWNLATLERMRMRTGTSQYDLRRQSDICGQLVQHCHELHVHPLGLRGHHCTRLEERLAAESAASAQPEKQPVPDGRETSRSNGQSNDQAGAE